MKNTRYLKQVIVLRRDLNMPHGKCATMAAHASMKFIVDRLKLMNEDRGDGNAIAAGVFTPDQWQWLTELDPGIEYTGQQSFAKIVVFVNNLYELLFVRTGAIQRNLTIGDVFDSGYSHNPPGTHVGIAIGPHWPEAFEGVTDHLKLR